MTDIRNQIINLIEPYMDKTLSEGCLIECMGDIETIKKIVSGNYFDSDTYFQSIEVFEFADKEFKIIGHYDITAVLKYIKELRPFVGNYEVGTTGSSFIVSCSFIGDDGGEDFIEEGEIPNKPLHLYTPQQEKDLLELLLKLK